MKKITYSILIFALAFTSCTEDEIVATQKQDSPTINLTLEHTFDGEPMRLDQKFVTANGDTIQVSELKYFISNLTLEKGASEITDAYGYHLIDVKNGAIQEMEIEGLEAGIYSNFSFGVGVDSAHNHTIESAIGDLDPAGGDNMIWSWSTGYKFLKFEGSFASKDSSGSFVIHTGGDANYKTFDFDHSVHLESGKATEIHLVVDIAELFFSPTLIDISKKLGHGGAGVIMSNMAKSDYTDKNGWFELHHVEAE